MAYAHVGEEIRRNLDDRSEKCMLVGYNEDSKECRLYNPITKKYIVSNVILCKEEEAWGDRIVKFVAKGAIISRKDDDGDNQVL